MNIKRYSIGGLVALSLMASSTCMAGTGDSYGIGSQCEQVGRQLEQLADSNQSAPCVESIELSSMYLEAAAKNLRRYKAPQASMNLNFALKEMTDLSATTKCAYFVPRVKPYIATVFQLKSDVEMLDSYLNASPQ